MQLVFALAALLVGLGLLEEWEGLTDSGSSHSAGAALNLRNAVGVLADKLALGLGALGLVAFPVAFRFFAYRLTFGLRGLAVSDTVRLFANSNTFGAVKHFTSFIRAFNFAFWFFAFNIANSVFRFRA